MKLRKQVAAVAVLAMAGATMLATAEAATAADTAVQTTFYASPSGSGTTCSSASPCSLVGARDKVRTVNADMTGDIIVSLKGGTYSLPSTFTLTESATVHDSGSNGFKVIYRNAPGEKPVLSGGETVSGFTLVDAAKNIYRAPVSADLETRQVYVNDQRATRARSDGNPGLARTETGYTLPASGPCSAMASWGAVSDIEVVAQYAWKQARYSVGSISGSTMTMDEAGWKDGSNDLPQHAARDSAWVENAYELLDSQGEWYLDRAANYMYYIPRTGEDLASAKVVAGRTEGLLTATGTTTTPIHDLKFDGITFSHDAWNAPSTEAGYPDFQGGTVIRGAGDWWKKAIITPAGVTFNVARDVTVQNSTFTHMANVGLAFGAGSQRNTVDHNTFTDISGNGMTVGGISLADHHPTDPETITKDNTISRNTISKIGVEYSDNVGIFLGFTRGSDVRNNTIHDLPYSGISMGWGHGYIDTLGTPIAGDNVIRGNLIYNYMNERVDGGGIYTLGSQLGSKIVDNYTYGQKQIFAGLYLDNGSAGFTVSNNVVGTQDAGSPYWSLINANQGGYYDAHDNSMTGNFYSEGLVVAYDGAPFNTLTANTAVTGPWPTAAQTVVDNAGTNGSPVTPLVVGDTSLATGKSAAASSTYRAGYEAGKAVDGDPSTRWSHADGAADPSWLQVDLGGDFWLTGTTIVPYLYYGKGIKYKIETSKDGSTWSTFADRTAKFSIPGADKPATAVTARFLRISITDTQGQGSSISEFKVYGSAPAPKPIAPASQGKTATASSRYSAELDASKAVDGDPATRWSRADDAPDPAWVQVDLGTVQPIKRTETKAFLYYGKPIKYKIEYSTDGTAWAVFADKTASFTTPGTDSVASAVNARYVRITVTDSNGQGASISEFQVFDSTPVSQGKPATASSRYSAEMDASKAVDGNPATRWSRAESAPDPTWVQVDLGTAQPIKSSETKAFLYYGKPVKYKIEYSTDGSIWTMFADKTASFTTPGTDTLAAAVNARYVRITLTDTQGQGEASLNSRCTHGRAVTN